MQKRERINLSIIIVHYSAKKELFACIESILNSLPRTSYEIIVVDNDERKTIERELCHKFDSIIYIKSPGNIGFGRANNLGAKHARGSLLFFLNPDTIVQPHAIDRLYEFIANNKDVGIVAPLLLDDKGRPFSQQGSTELAPLQGIVVLSFLNKLFPNNPIAARYLLFDWDKKTVQEVGVVPGTAFVIKRDVFKKIGGFDERFFLYFEESDLCRRVRDLGYKVFINPKAKVIHFGARSTVDPNFNREVFVQSRFYYFKKHFGLFPAIIVHIVTSIRNPLRR